LQKRRLSPREILDSNLEVDRNKLAYIGSLPNGNALVLSALQEQAPVTVVGLASRFGVQDVLEAVHDTTYMASLLYYFGVLTYGVLQQTGKINLHIPNLVVRRLYAERLQEMLLPEILDREAGQQAAEALYHTGNLQALCDFIQAKTLRVFDNRDYLWANELTIKTLFLTLLFNDTFYIMDSEPALQRSYADLLMLIRPEMRRYKLLNILLEFEYVGLSEGGLSGEQARTMAVDTIKRLPAMQAKLAQAQDQLHHDRHVLQAQYGDSLRLRTFAVVALGFDRLVWEEVA
jgi:hypothetical protein